MFHTYAHYKPQGGLFYIGKGTVKRAYAMDGRNSHWQNVVNKYGRPDVKLLARWDTEAEALDHEILLIACFRDMGVEIVNKTAGGEGLSGYKHTEEAKLKNSLAHIGQVPWNKGVPISDEQRIKLRNAKLGTVGNRKGKKNDPEHRAKISLANRGRKQTLEATEKARLKKLGRKQPLVNCPHCNKIGGSYTMPRWHFDNCRLKETT